MHACDLVTDLDFFMLKFSVEVLRSVYHLIPLLGWVIFDVVIDVCPKMFVQSSIMYHHCPCL